MRWLLLSICVVQVTAQCSGGCTAPGFPSTWNSGNREMNLDTAESKCCDNNAGGACMDERYQTCEETEEWYGKNKVCLDYQEECEGSCCNKYTEYCVKIDPRHDADWKWGVCAPKTDAGAAGMRIYFVPIAGFLFSIIATVVTMVFSVKGVIANTKMGGKILMVVALIVNFFSLFLYLGDTLCPWYAALITLVNCLLIGCLGKTSNPFNLFAVVCVFCVTFGAFGTVFVAPGGGGNTEGLYWAARGNGFNNGCADDIMKAFYRVIKPGFSTTFSQAMWDGNPAIDYWGLCTPEWFGFMSFVALLVNLLLATETIMSVFVIIVQ